MERAGLVARRGEPDDARAVRVRLTRRGLSMEGRCRRAAARIHSVVERGLGRREVAAAKRTLARMVENLRRAAP
jgi:DNA-binding MarR family transcriptional regulator